MIPKILLRPIKIKKFEINLWSIVLFAIGFYFDFFKMLVIAYIITAIHEFAHMLVAKLCNVEIDGVEILPFGITMRIAENCVKDTLSEIKIAMAGPLSNFLIAYFTYGVYSGVYKQYIIATSIIMGAFNLLPVLPLDGGRILRALLVKRVGHIRATNMVLNLSYVFGFLIFFGGLYTIYLTKFNFSVLLIGGFLIANITEERKNANMIIMKDILYSRKKLLHKGISKGEVLVAEENQRAKSVLKELSYDRYYIVKIVDNHMNIVKTVTETELIEFMAIYGMNMSMKKIVEF
ncbi:MAG: M50 family metallopeptidase [Clostridia bacterium]|nr:M50 family metallopeptidase [Clostridia bacterium]